jgi:hypothetical protein
MHLGLLAMMKMPGRGTLDFFITAKDEQITEFHQIAQFRPRGLSGLIYWYGLFPVHSMVFRGMVREIALFSGRTIVGGANRITQDKSS